MHLHLSQLSLCAVMALAAWAPAQAATSKVLASVDQFQYRLVDLDLNDGISPSLTITTEFLGVASFGGGQYQALRTYGTTATETIFGSSRSVLSDSTASVAATVNHPVPLDGVRHGYDGYSQRVVDFVLSPNTRMIFSGVATLTNEHIGYFEMAYSDVRVYGLLNQEQANGVMNEFDKTYSVRNGTETFNLNATLTSDSLARNGRFVVQTSATLVGPVSTVPEPSSYAMLLAGAFVVGSVARRRRRAAAPAA